MKNFYFMIGVAIAFCATALPVPSSAQTPSTVKTADTPIQLQGLVTDRKKYSFTVKKDGTEYKVKLAAGCVVGLKMNKPWFDWENEQVVVDAAIFPENSESKKPAKRVALKLPAQKLFLISRLGDAAKMKETMSADVKRLNFYLVTPEDPGPHFPTAQQPYLSGALSVKDKKAFVEVDQQKLPVVLGFRYATMNGFSITQLEPNKTQVFLSGTWADGEGEIKATRVLFQPVTKAESTVTSGPIKQPLPVAKQ